MKTQNKLVSSVIWIYFLLVIGLLGQVSEAEQQVRQFGITWTFDRDYTVGRFANGDYWVAGPVTIIAIDPPSIDLSGRIVNGSMINPSPRLGRRQGYDSVLFGRYTTEGDYDPSLNAARPNGRIVSESNPLVVPAGSSLVSTISTPQTDGRTRLQTAAVLTVLDGPAPEGSFRPPYSGMDKTIRFHASQLDYSLLANLRPVPGTPGLIVVKRYFERPWLDHIPGWIGRAHHPEDNMPNYDRDICTQIGIGALMLHLDFDKSAKELLLVGYTQVGIDLYGVVQDGGTENWSQDSGRKFPILFAGLVLNDPNMKNIGERSGVYSHTPPYGPGNPPHDLVRFEEDEMTFYVTQEDIDMTAGPEWNPDSRDAMRIPYGQEDIGLPEWGKVRLYDRTKINKCWATLYRPVICPAWGGFVLAMHIMGVKDLWNNDALFDYKDRFMQVERNLRETSQFVEFMWDAYRAHFGSVWTMSPTLTLTATRGTVTKTPAKRAYALGESVTLRAIADSGYRFAGWSGGLSGDDNPVTIQMHAHQSITANFTAIACVPGAREQTVAEIFGDVECEAGY